MYGVRSTEAKGRQAWEGAEQKQASPCTGVGTTSKVLGAPIRGTAADHVPNKLGAPTKRSSTGRPSFHPQTNGPTQLYPRAKSEALRSN